MKKLYFLKQNETALFCILFFSLMSALMEESRLLISASAFNVFWYVAWYEENLTSPRPVVGKWSLIVLQILRIFFFDIRLKLNKWSFLKASCNVQSKILSMNLLCTFTLKSICHLALWMALFFTHWLSWKVVLHWLMQNFQILAFRTMLKKHIPLILPSISSKKSEKYKFSKIPIFAWKLEFYHWQW